MKKICCLILGLCLLFSACSKRGGQEESGLRPEPQETASDGFHDAQAVLEGGTAMTGINLRSVTSETQPDGQIRVELLFVDGSDLMDIPEADVPDVPEYRTDWFEGADRFVLHLKGVVYWDYQLDPPETSAAGLQGLFSLDNDQPEGSDLVLHFAETMAYTLESEANRMILRFRPTEEEQENLSYLCVGGYERYYDQTSGRLGDLGFAPSLCSDGTSTVLLSVPFADEQQAGLYRDANASALSSLMPGLTVSVQSFPSNRLPEPENGSGLDYLADTVMAEKAGEPASELLVSGGRFLCHLPDGSGFLYARELLEKTSDGEAYQELVLRTDAGDAPVLDEFEFLSLDAAQCSADGRYAAVTEQTLFSRELSVVSLETKEVYSPREDGMEGSVSYFVWDTAKPVLYVSVKGEEGLSILSYDLTDPEHPAVALVANDFWEDNPLYFADGRIWTVQSDDNNLLRVCTVRVDKGTRSYQEEAYAMSLSPDGQTCVSLRSGEDGEITTTFTSVKTGKFISQTEGFEWIDTAWDRDGQFLYASAVRDGSGWGDEFPLTLCRIDPKDGSVTEWMKIRTGALYTGKESGEVWMLYIFSVQDQAVSMTYRLS